MADIEVKIYWEGRLIKTVMRPKRVIDGTTAVVYKKKLFALKPGCRIDVDKPPLSGTKSPPDQEIMAAANMKTPSGAIPVAMKRKEKSPTGTVDELARKLYGVTIEGGPARFRGPGWYSTGATVCVCPECRSTLYGLRKPYTSQGKPYHYWALVCVKCKVALELSQITDEQRKLLSKASNHRPSEADKPRLSESELARDQKVTPAATAKNPPTATPAAAKRREKPIEWVAEQRAVIDLETTARVLVSAGPGMGKTAVACARVAKLVANGVEPANIWLISFTRTAVREIRNRIAALVKKEDRASAVRITTLDSHAWHLAQGFDGESAKKIFRGYDETIESVIKLLEESSEALDEYLESLEHLIVDEAQDLVGLRADLVFALIKRLPASCGVTVFADDAQAIYGWSAEDAKPGELRDSDDNLSKRLRVSKAVPFRKMELRTVHRTDSEGLKKIFEFTRDKVLRPSANAAMKVLEIRTDIENFADAKIGEVLQQGVAGRDDILLLFRRRGEVLLASSFLLGAGIAHRVRMSGAPVCVAPWIGITLREFSDRYLTREQFEELWAKHMDNAGADHPGQEEAWSQLQVTAGDRGGRIEMRRLRAKLGTSSPPLVFCNPELGTNGPIVGTIHASKGREADNVHLMLPSDSGKHDTDEESRVLFVGATRARNSLHIGKGYRYSGSSLDGSGRAYRNSVKGKGTWANVEIGRAGDLDELSCVSTSNPFGAPATKEAQTLLSRFGRAIAPAKALCVRESDGSYRWQLMMQQGKKDIHLGLLDSRMVSDLFEVGKQVRAWQSWRVKLKPASQIEHMYIVGVRSVVLPTDHTHLESLERPYSESGIFLCPIVYGFPNVTYQSYKG